MTNKTIAPTLGFTLLLAIMSAIQPLSTDMYLPSLLSIATYFNTDMSQVQFTLTIYMVGFAIGQIFYGPFADKYGRKPVLLVGLLIYLAGVVVCLMAEHIEYLIIGRFLQALGGSAPVVLSRAIVRDMLKGAEAAKMLAQMGFIMGFVPLIAPIFGGFFETYFGWRSHFYVFLSFGIILVFLVVFLLPETITKKTTAKLSPLAFIKIYDGLWSSAIFRFFALRLAFGYGALFAFITGSSYYIQTRFELPPHLFGFAFAFVVLGFLTGTLISARFTNKLGIYKTIYIGAVCQILAGISMLLLHLLGVINVAQIVVPMFLFMLGNGIIMPQAFAGSMADFPHKAGAASSLAGVIQVTVGAVAGSVVGLFIESFIIILPLIIMSLSIVNFASCYRHRHHELSH